MTDCNHENATIIGSNEYRVVDGEQYLVQRFSCDDCSDEFATVMKEVGEVELDGGETPKQVIDRYRDGWS